MDHETAERVARAIYDVFEQDRLNNPVVHEITGLGGVIIDGEVNLIKCAEAAIAAYKEGAVDAIARLTRERDAAIADFAAHGRMDYEYQRLCRFCIGQDDCCHIELAKEKGWRLPVSCEDFTWRGVEEADSESGT